MTRVVVSGASGFLGGALAAALREAGYGVVPLVRIPSRGSAGEAAALHWDPDRETLDPEGLEGVDAVVHLAAAGIADGRWSAARKRLILESRTRGTALLSRAVARLRKPPAVLLCASATGFYGNTRPGEVATEGSPAGSGFLAEVCRAWEAAAAPVAAAGTRTVFMRLGAVLSPEGGLLKRVLPLFRAGLGGKLGSGRQPFPWIARDDAVRAALHCLEAGPALDGPVNFVSPGTATNRDFTRALGKALRRPAVFGVPGGVLRLVFGAMADELLLGGAAVAPSKLVSSGYRFLRPDLGSALSGLKRKTPSPQAPPAAWA